MRPIKIEFQAFGPYVDYEVVDFEALSSKGLFLICGKTGIGKTMILDAMTFALFGKSSGHGRDDFEAMRCTNAPEDKSTFVRFEFENNNEFYRFERRLERKRKNFSASYDVSRKDAEGIWRTLMENAKDRDVNAKAEEIIGLKYDQFRQVIVLPQGQFEKLLTSNSDEKEKILTSIFGEDKWQSIAEIFYKKASERKDHLKLVQDRIRNSLQEENCESIDQLELVIINKRNRIEEVEEEYKKADYEKIIKEQQEILALAKRFGDMHKAENRLEELNDEKEERNSWEKSLIDAKRADKVRKAIEESNTAKSLFAKRTQSEEKSKKNAEICRQAAEEATNNLKQHLLGEKDIDDLKTKKIQFEGKRIAYEQIDSIEGELKSANKDLDKAKGDEEKAKNSLDGLVEEIKVLKNQYEELQKEHSDMLNAYLAGITGEIAGSLVDGEPCPVCGSREHPKKAHFAENSVTKAMVDSKKKSTDRKYEELQKKTKDQEDAKNKLDEQHKKVEEINNSFVSIKAKLENTKKEIVDGISTSKALEQEITSIQNKIDDFEKKMIQYMEAEKKANDNFTDAKAKIESAESETRNAKKEYDASIERLSISLKENQFDSEEEAEKLMLSSDEMEELSAQIAEYDASLKTVKDTIKDIKEELIGKKEPDEEKCQEIMDEANNAKADYIRSITELRSNIDRLDKKLKDLRDEGEGIEDRIREAEEDYTFAKKLRGDSGTGLQRYVLGIMFSSVITAANKMLEMVHGGRYRLYRSDEKAQGTNKRGLELKVFDNNSEEHDGRFVSTLSGGEKFLASLALSIGMSTVAQKSGIKIEALFIDEGFGSLDDASIGDAMNVLNSIQEANGLVGIISHVQLLQDQIPSKLRVMQEEKGSHIVQTVG